MDYQTLAVRWKEPVCFIRFNRPEQDNTINHQVLEECSQVLDLCENSATIVVIEGSPQVFSMGADLHWMRTLMTAGQSGAYDPEPLYALWTRLAAGPYVTIAHVRGRANAGGLGFVAASDIVLADETAQFSLSELLFGVLPACVLPFLIRKVGFQRAHYMTLMTQPFPVEDAHRWGLVDAHQKESELLVLRHVSRLRRLSKAALRQYKRFTGQVDRSLMDRMPAALAANREAFSAAPGIDAISRFVEEGVFPWQA